MFEKFAIKHAIKASTTGTMAPANSMEEQSMINIMNAWHQNVELTFAVPWPLHLLLSDAALERYNCIAFFPTL